jgi:hypothetical protein
MQQGYAAWIRKHLIQDPWIWTLESDFQCGAAKGEKKEENLPFFFCARHIRFFPHSCFAVASAFREKSAGAIDYMLH